MNFSASRTMGHVTSSSEESCADGALHATGDIVIDDVVPGWKLSAGEIFS